MTLSLTLPTITVEGNGATSTFAYPFEIPTAVDAVVIFTDTNGIQTTLSQTQFAISGLGTATGGAVVYPLAGSPIASGTFLTIQRILPLVQTTAVSYDGPAFGSLENELDYQMMVLQQINYILSRTIQLNVADINPVPQLPPAAQRALQPLVFDSAGNPTVGQLITSAFVSAALQPFLAASTTQAAVALLNYLSPLAGAQVRNLVAKINDIVSIQDFIGTGSDYGPAITAAFAVANEVLFPAGSYPINTNATIANGKRAVLSDGASFTVANGMTLTVNGLFEAPSNAQCFFGTGSVVGMREAYPEWWGADTNNSSVDSQPALQAAHTAIQASLNSDGGRPTIRLGPGTYFVGNTWTLSPTANCQLAAVGEGTIFGGTRFQTLAGFPAAPVVFVQGNADPIQGISDWELRGFCLENGGGSPTVGLKIGNDNNTTQVLNGLHTSLIEDILVDDNGATRGFPAGVQFCNVRLVTIRRLAVWSRVGPTGAVTDTRSCIHITQVGQFTGDMTFDDCQYVGSVNTNVAGLLIDSTSGPATGDGNHEVAGIRFNGLIGYLCGSYVLISAQNGSKIHDLWFNPGCQWDAGSISGLFMQSDGAFTYLQNIHFDGCYIDGATADQVNLIVSNGGLMLDVWVVNCWSSQTQSRFLVTGGTGTMNGLHVCGNEVNNNNNHTGAAISINTPTQFFDVSSNIATHDDGQFFDWLVQIGLGCNNFTVTNNIANTVAAISTISDLSGAVSKAVVNNV